MTFSVIVPSYRRPDDLRRCLSGILRGTRLPDELVAVVRDTDEESQTVVEECRQTPHGRLVRGVLVTPPGQVPAINAGLAVATGEVVVLTDDDTEPSEVWLERLARLYADPQVVGAGGWDRVMNEPPVPIAQEVGRLTWYGRLIGNHHRGCVGVRRVQHLKGANMSFRRTALPAFDPNLTRAASMLNDTDASLGAGRRGVLLYDPEARVDHYPAPRGAGVTRDVNDPGVVRADSHNWVYCVLKHSPWWARPVCVLYALVVGQGACLGPAKWLWGWLRGEGRSLRQLWAATCGKLDGLRTFVLSQGGRRVLPAPEARRVP
jgi:glycosyltransferase involved in cell wall biosynthesis